MPLVKVPQTQTRERRRQVLEFLRNDTVLSIRDLSKRLEVSAMTIRRDLNALQKQGVVERLHGGVHLLQSAAREMDKREVDFYIRQKIAVKEKQAIARAACRFLPKDQVIALDASTTCHYFVQAIPNDIPLTILTYSAHLPIELAGRHNLQTIGIGGILHPTSLCYLGTESENSLQQFFAHRAFLGAKGITVREGCTDANFLEVRLKSLLVQRVQELFILADHTKLGNIALSSFASLNQVHTLITDEHADPEIVQAFRDQGVEVVVAPLSP